MQVGTVEYQNKLVLFGAGKIGRSFIGPLFSRGGWEVVFIDVYKAVIEELNIRRSYNVVIKGEGEEVIDIQKVRGVHVDNIDQVLNEIFTARIMAVSVGFNGLKALIPLIAKGLIKRFENRDALPLDIIIAENLRNAAEFMNCELRKYLPMGFPLEERIGLIETSIGKMVPIMLTKDLDKDMLQVFAERYNKLILDKKAFKSQIPEIEGLAPKENMKAWVDRKLFIHNLGHATAAYLGFLAHPDAIFLYEVLSDSLLKENVRNTMLQAADILIKKYPGEFSIELLTEHIDDLLQRFQNKALGDTLFRIGCDLERKLGPHDRLAGAIYLAWELDLPYDLILKALVCGFHFRATDQDGKMFPGDIGFAEIVKKGIRFVMENTCGFNQTNERQIIEAAEEMDKKTSVV